MGDMISVITLSYNNLNYFEECLESIIQQDYENIEWILCDDGSAQYDFYEQKIRDFLARNPHHIKQIVFSHSNKNQGIIANYRRALDLANGEYIFYLAIDDLFFDNHVLDDVVSFFEETEYEILGGYWESYYENGNVQLYPSEYEIALLQNAPLEVIFQRFIRRTILIGSCVPYRRSLIDRLGFFDAPQLQGYVHLEDWPRYLYLMEQGVRFGFLPRKLIKYRAGGITTEIANAALRNDYKKLLDRYMMPPYSRILQAMQEKKYLVSWGSSGGFLFHYKQWESITGKKFDWLVDSDADKWGQHLEGKEIRSPETLKDYAPGDIFITVCSQSYYVEIADRLEKMGFRQGEDFDILSREVIIWIS